MKTDKMTILIKKTYRFDGTTIEVEELEKDLVRIKFQSNTDNKDCYFTIFDRDTFSALVSELSDFVDAY